MAGKIEDLLESSGAMAAGHYVMADGRHTDMLLRPVKILQFPPYCRKAAYEIVKHYWDMDVQLVVAAEAGAILFAAEIARQLEARIVYSVSELGDPAADFELREGFSMHAGDRIMLVDTIRTSEYPHLRALGRRILQNDARLIGTSTMFDVSGEGTMLGARQISVVRTERNTWAAEDCPLCAAGKALDDPAALGRSHL